jgi:hypothetical protein
MPGRKTSSTAKNPNTYKSSTPKPLGKPMTKEEKTLQTLVDPVKDKLRTESASKQRAFAVSQSALARNVSARSHSAPSAKHLPREIIAIDPLPNSKFRSRDQLINPLCYANGPDGYYMKEYDYLEKIFKNQIDNSAAYRDFEEVRDDIRQRQGQVRCKEGIHRAFEFPLSSSTSIAPLELGNRLKFVVVQHKYADDYIVLMTNAYMENYNYAGENILKWTDTVGEHVTIRQSKKDIVHINPALVKVIEDWGRDTHGYTYPPWGMLLGTKTEYPEEYKRIITQYFVETGSIKAADINNTLFLDTINEISHSAIPYMYHEKPIKTDEDDVPLVFIGAEAVFYMDNGKLCFIICNLSGHFRTPPDRMQTLIRILVRDYGYNEDDLILLTPPPPPPPSSQDTYDSDASEPREDFRTFVSNVRSMTFGEAASRLNASIGNNAHPVIGPVDDPYSQPNEFSEEF